MVNGVAGFRGAVSPAAALAVPHAVASGQPFPARDLIVFVTTGVIIATLVIPALIMPAAVVRWPGCPPMTLSCRSNTWPRPPPPKRSCPNPAGN